MDHELKLLQEVLYYIVFKDVDIPSASAEELLDRLSNGVLTLTEMGADEETKSDWLSQPCAIYDGIEKTWGDFSKICGLADTMDPTQGRMWRIAEEVYRRGVDK
jgi:hypothetical protein